jgi:protein involved in polysaccharide export with SLBB domain
MGNIPALVRSLILGGIVSSLALFSIGCAGSLTQGLTGATGFRHKLIDDAERMRSNVITAQPLPTELNKVPLTAYIIEPGDTLIVEPVSFESRLRFPADQTVLPDGTIDLNEFGRMLVVGKTIEEIEAEIDRLIKERSPQAGAVNVRLVGPQSKRFYVLGEVNSPGDFQYIGRETALSAILAAGGLSDKADVKNIILSRPSVPDGCRTVLPICYNQIVQLGDTSTNYQILPGDRIYVPTKSMLDCVKDRCKKCITPCSEPQYQCPVDNASCAVPADVVTEPVMEAVPAETPHP